MIKKLEKADGQSMDIVESNIEQLRELFPEVFAEGKINFDRLQEVLGNYLVTDEDHYNFTWHGKRAAGRLAQTPSTGTLRPCPEESVDWDKTQNLFIEGDNLEVLKLLQKSYHRQIKMIYIDPPYNTGNDFVYEDDFKDGVKNYLAVTGQLDNEGKKKGTNSSSAGRYHTNWLNMMYPRLKLARNLLRDDGVIFISIDDSEQDNLKKICNEIYGEENFIGVFPWRSRTAKADVPFGVSSDVEWVIAYGKPQFLAGRAGERKYYKSEDYEDRWRLSDLTTNKTKDERGNSYFTMINPRNGEGFPASATRTWAVTVDTFPDYYAKGKIVFPGDYPFLNIKTPAFRVFESEDKEKALKKYGTEEVRMSISTYLPEKDVGRTEHGSKEIRDLFENQVFSYPKPTGLIKFFVQNCSYNNDIVLDFFAGSGTTADAVMQVNQADDGKRRYIVVQLPEVLDEKKKEQKTAFDFCKELGLPARLSEITKARIRRAAKKIKEENPSFSGDLGFKVFKLDTSNIKTWEAGFDTLKDDLIAAADYIKQDRSSDDIVFELLLKYGLDLTVPIETRTIAGKKVYSIGMGALVVCLDNDVPMDVVNGIGALKEELKPEIMRVVFKDSGFKDDVVKTNALQTLKRFGIEDIKSL